MESSVIEKSYRPQATCQLSARLVQAPASPLWRPDMSGTPGSTPHALGSRAMKIVFGHTWGIWWWRTAPSHTTVLDCVAGFRDTHDLTGNLGVLKAAGATDVLELGRSRGIPADVPLDVVVPPGETHRTTKTVLRHPSKTDYGPGTLCKIGNGMFVLTPEVCFCQVAGVIATTLKGRLDSRLHVVVLVRLGLELCGGYSLSVSKRGFVDRNPLTNVGRLVATALGLENSYGMGRVWEAMRWIADGSRSPKETDLYLVLCLPAELGGFAFPRPILNHVIDVRGVREGFFRRWETCTVDLYWAYARLVVEYDSKTNHEDLGEEKVTADAERADALKDLGYEVVTIRTADLYDDLRLREKAQDIATALHVELPVADGEFAEMHRKLVNMLLRHDRWV